MKITEILSKEKKTLSFEVFPPKSSSSFESVKDAVQKIAALTPSFVSVTYGAGGGTRKYTLDIARDIMHTQGVPTLAHLSCVCSSAESVREKIAEFREAGIENIMALRGDIPAGTNDADRAQWTYKHATDLVEELVAAGGFCIGGACYPEVHPESKSRREDRLMLKKKVDAGCSFLTTQMFFDNSIYYRFLDELSEVGVDVPIIPGIMPITSPKQVAQIVRLSSAYIPENYLEKIERYADDPVSIRKVGIECATLQIRELFESGVKNVHVYTMNKPDVAAEILGGLSDILDR